MKKTSIKKFVSMAIFSAFAISMSMTSLVSAANITADDAFGGTAIKGQIQTGSGLGTADPRAMAAKVINIMLGFLGIIAVVIILFGGFKWMTAAGNDDKVGEAKKLLGAGVIGLVIVLMSYGLAQFVINSLVTATQ